MVIKVGDVCQGRPAVWVPQPRQAIFMARGEDEVLFGGAAGGGKSDVMVVEALRQVHMEYIRSGEQLTRSDLAGDTVPHYKQGEQVEPVSAWLFNSIQNFHADYMDNFPRANVLPREEGDALEAEKLTRILPSLLDRIGFEAVYSRAGWTKAIQGWTVYTVTWDREADGGRGEISIGRAKLLNLYWDIEVDDLEASSDVFYLHERDKDELIREYPKLERDLVATDGEYESHRDETLGGEPT